MGVASPFGVRVVLALFLAAAAPAAGAEGGSAANLTEMSLEDLMEIEVNTVVSASRYVQDITDAPASVSIITREEIGRYGYRTMAELLSSIIGFNVTNDRSYEYLGVRGYGMPSDWNSRVLLLIDGHRINEPVYGSAVYGWGLGVDLGNVSKVEVVRGPASALYGTNAMFAVVNVVTMKPDREPGKELELTLSDPGISRLAARARGRSGKVGYVVDAYILDREGNRVLNYPEFTDPNIVDEDGDGNPDYASGSTRGTDEGDAKGFRARLETGSFTLTGFFSKWIKDVPTAQYFTLFDTDLDWVEESRGYLEAAYGGGGDSAFTWQAKISLDNYRYRGDYAYAWNYNYHVPNYTEPPFTINKDDQSALWTNIELQGDYSGWSRNRLVFGIERSSIDTEIENYDKDPFYEYTDVRESTWSMSAYVQDEVRLSDTARVVMGVNRTVYDDSVYTGDVERTNPRLGVVIGIGARSRVKVLYGEAFRVPNLYEMLYDDGSYLVANPDLGAEVMRTSEVIFEHGFSKTLNFRGAAYQNKIEDLIRIEEIAPGTFQYQNTPENVASQGVELLLTKTVGEGLSGFASVALQRTETEEGGEELPNSPREMANLGMSIPLVAGRSYLNIDTHYTGERRSADLSEDIDAFLVANATLTHRAIVTGVEVSLSVRNLFDASYADPGSVDHVQKEIPQDGRGYSLQVKYRF